MYVFGPITRMILIFDFAPAIYSKVRIRCTSYLMII